MSEAAPTKSKCSPEQLERLGRAREKALERRQALAALKRREKELAEEAIKDRIRKVEEMEMLYKNKRGDMEIPLKGKSKSKSKSKPPPPPSESDTEEESTSETDVEPVPPPKSKRKSKRSPSPPPTKMRHQQAYGARQELDWDALMRRVFPLD